METLDFDSSFVALETGCVTFATQDAGLWILGADRKSWLQGQITNDVRRLSSNSPLAFCLCNPSGQIEAIGRLFEAEDRFLMISDARGVSAMQARIASNVILEDVTCSKAEEEIWTVQGKGCPEGAFSHDRTGRGGFDAFGPVAGLPLIDPRANEVAVLEAGKVVPGVDTTVRSLPPELGPVFDAQHVSYEKGCFTGQEILHRIYSRGTPSKVWVGLQSEEPLMNGGAINRACFSPKFGHIAAATVHKDVARAGTIIEIEGQRATVVEMPFLRP